MTGDPGRPGVFGMKGEKGLPGAPGSRVSVWIYSLISLSVCIFIFSHCARIDYIDGKYSYIFLIIHIIYAPSLFILSEWVVR